MGAKHQNVLDQLGKGTWNDELTAILEEVGAEVAKNHA
jgi:hypothetical protein